MSKEYSIRDLAEEFDVTTRSLRFYEEKDLLNPFRQKQTRTYSNADRTRLKLILRGKRLGLSLDETAELIKMYDPDTGNTKQTQEMIVKVREKRKQLLDQQKDLEVMLLDLRDAEEKCVAALTKSKRSIK